MTYVGLDLPYSTRTEMTAATQYPSPSIQFASGFDIEWNQTDEYDLVQSGQLDAEST